MSVDLVNKLTNSLAAKYIVIYPGFNDENLNVSQ